MSDTIRVPVRTYAVTPARPIPAGDQRILDAVSRKRLLMTILWHVAGCVEQPLSEQ